MLYHLPCWLISLASHAASAAERIGPYKTLLCRLRRAIAAQTQRALFSQRTASRAVLKERTLGDSTVSLQRAENTYALAGAADTTRVGALCAS